MQNAKVVSRSLLAVTALVLAASPVPAKQFSAGDKVAKMMDTKYKMPVFFMVPDTARAPLPADIKTTDTLVEYRHPDAKDAKAGLRLIVTKRSGMGKRLAESGLVQTGDILLTFRPEWGGAGAYPNVQMGISHTGVAWVKDGEVHNLDNPLSEEYNGSGGKGNFGSEHYRTLNLIHVIRPRTLTNEQRANIVAWAAKLNGGAKRIYPSQLSFNQDYNAPKFHSGRPLSFVKDLGGAALGQAPSSKLDLYCSEFVWSVLSLRSCDPTKPDTFKGSGVPSCISAPMKPMQATGSSSYSGLADGPLLVVDSLGLPKAQREAMLHSIFIANPDGLKKMSVGHRTLAEAMQADFAHLEQYYLGSGGGVIKRLQARFIASRFKRKIPENYSPTSFLVNTFLAPNNSGRTMDYVATIVIE